MAEIGATATPLVPFEVDGALHTLRFSTRALVAVEEVVGKTPSELVPSLALGSWKTLCVLLWAGMLHEGQGKAPSLDWIIDNLPMTDAVKEEAVSSIFRAMAIAQGQDPDEILKRGDVQQEGGAEEGKATT